jgi:hypothetical protein
MTTTVDEDGAAGFLFRRSGRAPPKEKKKKKKKSKKCWINLRDLPLAPSKNTLKYEKDRWSGVWYIGGNWRDVRTCKMCN